MTDVVYRNCFTYEWVIPKPGKKYPEDTFAQFIDSGVDDDILIERWYCADNNGYSIDRYGDPMIIDFAYEQDITICEYDRRLRCFEHEHGVKCSRIRTTIVPHSYFLELLSNAKEDDE